MKPVNPQPSKKRFAIPAAVAIVISWFCMTSSAHAAVCRVTPTGNGANSVASWSQPMSLGGALARQSCTEIWVAAGVYKPSSSVTSLVISAGTALYGGFAGNETARDDRNPAAHLTILSGDVDNNDVTDANGITQTHANIRGRNSYNVVFMIGRNGQPIQADTIVDGFTITAGQADGNGPISRSGGGMVCATKDPGDECSPTLRKLTFVGNRAAWGGGLYIESKSEGIANPVLTNLKFLRNRATAYGGGLFLDASIRGSNTATLADILFEDNISDFDGGGLAITGIPDGNVQPQLTNVTFRGNTADSKGGAAYIDARAATAKPTFAQVTFENNQADLGGAVFNDAENGGTAKPSFHAVAFRNNHANNDGGAVFNQGTDEGTQPGVASPGFSQVTFKENTAARGGAVFNDGADGESSPTFVEVRFLTNEASWNGGAIYSNATATPTTA